MDRLCPKPWRAQQWGMLAALLVLLAAGCGRVAPLYPRDIFPEMHYQQTYRSQEPPRMAPAADSVPMPEEFARGEGPAVYTLERALPLSLSQAAGLKNPVPLTQDTRDKGKELYRINCAVCHGANGRGDSLVIAPHFQRANVTPPVDFASERIRSRTDGELLWAITNGFNQIDDSHGLTRMPSFRALLTEEERWTLVHFIRSVGAQ